MKIVSRSLADTRRVADELLSRLNPGDTAAVIALEGELGAGKTAFCQEAGKVLGIAENMHSPTFVIMKVYEIDFRGFKNLVHVDAYRIERESELLHLGWNEIIREPENLVLIEWPERVPGILPADAKRVGFAFIDEAAREINYESQE